MGFDEGGTMPDGTRCAECGGPLEGWAGEQHSPQCSIGEGRACDEGGTVERVTISARDVREGDRLVQKGGLVALSDAWVDVNGPAPIAQVVVDFGLGHGTTIAPVGWPDKQIEIERPA